MLLVHTYTCVIYIVLCVTSHIYEYMPDLENDENCVLQCVLQCVAESCSVLQSVEVCCSML